jgi:MFS family permease
LLHKQKLSKETQQAMKLNTVEGAFAVAADNLAAPYLSLFALALGATPSQIGMLSAFPNFLGNILQIPASILSERSKDKRILPTVGGFFNRASWLVLALLPFLFSPQHRVAVVIILASFRIVMANLGVPAWTSLQADLVPRSIRGQYYANRNMVLNMCALGATVLATFLLRLDFPTSYILIFSIATLLGVISTYIFIRIPFANTQGKPGVKGEESLAQRIKLFAQRVGEHKDFRAYLISSLIWNFGVTVAGSLFPVYFVDIMGGQAGSWAIFTGINLAAQVIIQRYWGRMADTAGQKKVMALSGLGVVFLPMLWWIAPNTWFPILIYVVNGIAWGGYNLASFNLILEITPDDNRSLYVAVYNTLMGVATSLGPLVGGFAAEIIGLRPIFLISSVLRGLGLAIFIATVGGGQKMQLQGLLTGKRMGKTTRDS